jgi:thymidylate synthase
MIVSGWNPEQCDNVALPPCHTLFHFAAEEQENEPRKLHCQLYQRSADVFLGVPYNVAIYSLLTVILAHVHNMVPGDFVHTFGDLHIYANHFEQVDEQLSRDTRPLPTITIDDSLRGGGFEALMSLKYEHLTLNDYNPHPSIKAKVAV